jgi:hypothetical protein
MLHNIPGREKVDEGDDDDRGKIEATAMLVDALAYTNPSKAEDVDLSSPTLELPFRTRHRRRAGTRSAENFPVAEPKKLVRNRAGLLLRRRGTDLEYTCAF